MSSNDYLYLHGFASSPQSTKAQYLSQYFSDRQRQLILLDLNQGGFSHLTLTRIIEQTVTAIPDDRSVTLIGSSLGGLAVAWVAEQALSVSRLVLLAPAFGFCDRWYKRLGSDQLQEWQNNGSMLVYHYGEKRSLPLNYGFVEDLARYDDRQLQRPIPTLILHGRHDDIVPIKESQAYGASRPWVRLIDLSSDHSLTDVLPEIVREIAYFCP